MRPGWARLQVFTKQSTFFLEDFQKDTGLYDDSTLITFR